MKVDAVLHVCFCSEENNSKLILFQCSAGLSWLRYKTWNRYGTVVV